MKILGNQEIAGVVTVGRRVNEGFKSVTLTSDIEMNKPSEKFWKVATTLTNAKIKLPNATSLTNGYEIIFIATTTGVEIVDNSGNSLQVLDPGTIYYFYLTSNTSIGGEWAINVDTSYDITVGVPDSPNKGVRAYFKVFYEYEGNIH